MTIRIDAPTPDDVRFVAAFMRRRDVEEFLPLSAAETREQLVAAVVQRWADAPDLIGAYDGVLPVGIGAMHQARPGVASLLFFATDHFPKIALPLTKAIRDRIFPAYRAQGVHRIECTSLSTYHEAHRWIGLLGLTKEAELKGFGKNGETYLSFSWVDDACKTCG